LDHDEVGCTACIAIGHKTCQEAVYITKTAKGISKTSLPKDVKEEISRVKKDLFLLKMRRTGDKARFTKQRDSILVSIGSLRKRMNEVFDRLEKVATEKLREKFDTDIPNLKHDIHRCEEAIQSLEASLKKLAVKNEAELFINIKKDAKKSLQNGESVILSVTEHLGQEEVKFTIDESLEEWLSKLNSLGKFDHEQAAYTGALFGKFDLNQKSDSHNDDYVFNGSVNLPDGKTVITDWKNKKLKLLDTNYTLRSHCEVPGEPYSVCCISNQLVAVTLRDEKVIQFVAIENMAMKLDKRFKIDEYCRGIAYHNDRLYVTVGGGEGEIHGQLRVYSMSGDLVRIYAEDIHSKPFFILPGQVIVNDDGSRFHVADHKRGVVTVTKDCRQASIFTDRALKSPFGLCMDGKGNLYVSGEDSNNVIQFSADGRKISEVLKEEDGILHPLAICCHESVNTRLIVTMENSLTVKVFTLQEK
jgi:sugar lactone lactonase YvrE